MSSNSRYKSKNDADKAISVVSLTYNSGGYINGRNSANLELLIDKTSSIYLYMKLKALASWIFLSFTSFWRNSDSYEHKNKSARRVAQDMSCLLFASACTVDFVFVWGSCVFTFVLFVSLRIVACVLKDVSVSGLSILIYSFRCL